jgi:hypothetical protein
MEPVDDGDIGGRLEGSGKALDESVRGDVGVEVKAGKVDVRGAEGERGGEEGLSDGLGGSGTVSFMLRRGDE